MNMSKKIILASTSPRRKELLEREGIDFIVDASFIDETLNESLPIEERLCDLARRKAFPIHQKYPNDIVIGADTVVYFENEVIGKAQDEQMARHILERLSNQKHVVYTGVAIYFGQDVFMFCEKTEVYFRDIHSLIPDYLASKEWVGKAGAYGIQGKANCFVDYIVGDLDNVIGLPVKKVMECLQQK